MSEYALMLEEFCVYIQFVPDCDSVRSSDLVTVGSKNPMLFGPLKSAQSPKVCALRLIPGKTPSGRSSVFYDALMQKCASRLKLNSSFANWTLTKKKRMEQHVWWI